MARKVGKLGEINDVKTLPKYVYDYLVYISPIFFVISVYQMILSVGKKLQRIFVQSKEFRARVIIEFCLFLKKDPNILAWCLPFLSFLYLGPSNSFTQHN